MLTDEDIAEINKDLSLCDTYLLNDYEIELMNAVYVQLGLSGLKQWAFITAGDSGIIVNETPVPIVFEEPLTQCDYYQITQQVLVWRSNTDSTMKAALDILQVLATLDSCPLTVEPEIIPDVNIPYFGGGL